MLLLQRNLRRRQRLVALRHRKQAAESRGQRASALDAAESRCTLHVDPNDRSAEAGGGGQVTDGKHLAFHCWASCFFSKWMFSISAVVSLSVSYAAFVSRI